MILTLGCMQRSPLPWEATSRSLARCIFAHRTLFHHGNCDSLIFFPPHRSRTAPWRPAAPSFHHPRRRLALPREVTLCCVQFLIADRSLLIRLRRCASSCYHPLFALFTWEVRSATVTATTVMAICIFLRFYERSHCFRFFASILCVFRVSPRHFCPAYVSRVCAFRVYCPFISRWSDDGRLLSSECVLPRSVSPMWVSGHDCYDVGFRWECVR